MGSNTLISFSTGNDENEIKKAWTYSMLLFNTHKKVAMVFFLQNVQPDKSTNLTFSTVFHIQNKETVMISLF